MSLVLGLSEHTGARLAEVGFLLVLIAGFWIGAGGLPRLGLGNTRAIVAGVLLAAAGVLLIIATHWGHFG